MNNVFLVNALSLMYGKSNTKPVVWLVVKVRNYLYILQNNWIIQLLHYPDPLGPADKEKLADRFKTFLISHYILSNDPFVIYKFYFPEYYMSYKNIILSFSTNINFSGIQKAAIKCLREKDQAVVADSLCSLDKKPTAENKACDSGACPPSYSWKTRNSSCSVTCGVGKAFVTLFLFLYLFKALFPSNCIYSL